MKRIISFVLSISIVLSALSVVVIFPTLAEKIENGYVNSAGDYVSTPITFEKAEDTVSVDTAPIRFEYKNTDNVNNVGYVDVRDSKFVLVGRRPTDKPNADTDSKPTTKGITGQNLSDFSIKYLYNVADNAWCLDGIFFHTDDENPSSVLSVLVAGRKFRDTKTPVICITKDIELKTSVFTGAAFDSNTGVYSHSDGVFTESGIAVNTDYYIEIEVKGRKVDVFVYDAKDKKPSSPTLSYEHDVIDQTSGDISFTGRTGGCTFSKITLKDITNNKLICEKYSPALYNNSKYVKINAATTLISDYLTNGTMAYTEQGYRLYSKSDVDGKNRPITSSVVKPSFNETTENYNLSFDYIHNVAGGKSSVLLNSTDGTAANAPLTLNITDEKLEIMEGSASVKETALSLDINKVYQVEIEKTALCVKVWLYEKGGSKSETPLLEAKLLNAVSDGAVYFHTDNGDFTVNNIKLSANDGYFDVRNGKFTVAGKTSNGNDEVVITKGITGKALTDFTMEYTYNTLETKYNRNFITMHTDVDNPNPENKFVFTISGNTTSYANGGYATPYIIMGHTRVKDGSPKHSTSDMKIYANTDYRVRLKVSTASKKIEAWIWEQGKEEPKTPTLIFEDDSIAKSSGDIAIGCRTNAYTLSDITIIDDAENKAICENYSPIVYNDDTSALTKTQSGSVTYTAAGYRINANSLIGTEPKPVSTAALPVGDVFGNFELSVGYCANSSIGTNKILFNSTGVSGSGYSLTLSANKVALFDSGKLLSSKDIVLDTGKFYTVDISRLDYSINVYIYEKGGTKPATATLSYTDIYPLGKGNIYFYTSNGDFTLSAIDLEITDISSDSIAITDKHTVYNMPEITIQKAKADLVPSDFTDAGYDGGIVNIRDGRVVISGYTEAINGSRRPSGLRKTIQLCNSLAHRTTWLRSDFPFRFHRCRI